MSSNSDETSTSVPLLMRCGYRSKVCNNVRASKIDGTLHKMCDFHRRKANQSQKRLHDRKRAKLAEQQQAHAFQDELPPKRACLTSQYYTVDPMSAFPVPMRGTVAGDFKADVSPGNGQCYPFEERPGDFTSTNFTPDELGILGSLLDKQPPSVEPQTHNFPSRATETPSIIL